MIRILQVVTHMNRGGLETMLMNYYRHMDRNQIQFDFLTHREYDGDYGEEIKKLGGIIYHLPVLNPFSIRYKRKLGEFFDSHPEYQVIHVHQDCLSSVILKEAEKHGVRVRIAHSHNMSQDKDIKYPVKMYFRRRIPRYATELMACSREAGEWMFRGKSFRVLNNAIDARAYRYNPQVRAEQRRKYGVAESELLLGHVGRFNYPKNHDFLIDVFEAVQKRTAARLMLVGDGNLRERIEEKVKRLGLTDKVIFTGVRDDVAELLQAMDVFVFPSIYEGLPVTVIEAQASGLPCLISTQVPAECMITDLARRALLEDGAEGWADQILAAAQATRRDTSQEIANAGFDVIENAGKLENKYMRLMRQV